MQYPKLHLHARHGGVGGSGGAVGTMRKEWSASRPGHLSSDERTGTHYKTG